CPRMPAKRLAPPGELRIQSKPLVRREGLPGPLPRSGWYLASKRVLDLVLTLVLTVPAAVLVVLSVLLVKLTTRGSAFYSQIRLGQGGRPFRLYKIRTMVVNAEKDGACWSPPSDPRITRIGHFLRATHLDELPQLWNVLLGDMSLVGPRPERPEFVPSLEQAVPCYHDRLLIRPWLTGLAQLQLAPGPAPPGVRRELVCDLYYVQHLGLWLDLRLIVATVFYLVGFSERLLQRVLCIPRGKVIETNYRHLVEERASVASRLPADPSVNGKGHA